MKLVEFTNKGIYCIPGKFYIDPWKPVDLAIISHGHGDHARWGMKKYLCHHFTKPILKHRIGEDIEIQSVEYGEEININGVKVSFFPAGHIVGSAQIRMEYKGFVTVFSGDYKVQDDGLSTPFELVKCNEFITESTFGLPIYNWLSPEQYSEQMKTWVEKKPRTGKNLCFHRLLFRKSATNYEVTRWLRQDFRPSFHRKNNEAIESSGIQIPEYETVYFNDDLKKVNQEIVILPPALLDSNLIRKIPNRATGICSGWMQVRGSRRWRSADAGFAISDHADWNGLLETVKATGAEKVHVTHGQTAVFSKYLNELGIDADEVKTNYGDEETEEKEILEGNK